MKNKCYCCHKEKECILIDSIKNNMVEQRPICNLCNHLKLNRPSLQGKPKEIRLGE
jgi:hypothetical protein